MMRLLRPRPNPTSAKRRSALLRKFQLLNALQSSRKRKQMPRKPPKKLTRKQPPLN
jgi:hypothetical protein